MAKDDYDVLVFKILTYYYACLKRKVLFNQEVFDHAIIKSGDISDEYLADVLRMMQEEGLLQGLTFTKAWGEDYILASDLRDAKITPAGVHYLKENSTMQKIMKALVDAADTMGNLAGILGLMK